MHTCGMITNILFANFLTAFYIYTLYRLVRNEHDLKAIGLFLLCTGAGLLIVFGERQAGPKEVLCLSAPPTGDLHSQLPH